MKSVRVVGRGSELPWDIQMKLSWSEVPGVIYVDVPEDLLDQEVTVLAVDLEGAVALYRDGGGVMESN